MQKEAGFIKYVVIIAVILIAVFLSQQAFFSGVGNDLTSKASGAISGYLAKGANWASNEVYSKVSGEVQKRGEIIKNEVNSEKEKVSENIGEKIKNYFSGIADSVVHPGNNSCQASQ